MASYFPMLQQFMTSAATNSEAIVNEAIPIVNATMAATEGQTVFPTDVSSFITFLYSYSALRDWFKLIVIGGLFESCRRALMSLYYKVGDSFFIRASFDQSDASYNWILVWLSKQPSWSKTRDMQITTRAGGGNSPAVILEGEEESANQFYKSSRKISYLPSASLTYSLWYKRRWMTITRVQQQTYMRHRLFFPPLYAPDPFLHRGMYGDKENTLYISILTRDHNILTELLQEARQFYMAGQEHNMCIYVSDSTGSHWNHVACRAKRSMRSIVLDPGVKDILLEDARDFLRSKSWYAERGIPFRRGYLLYGAPGSGKTSMIHCMAGELGLDVYIISLSRAGLDDASLSELVNALPERCVAIMEDIDAAFTHGVSRENPSESGEEDAEAKKANPGGQTVAAPTTTTSKLSLSGLLNALDGVGAQEGRILFATTNKYSALDPALCRPGRMDLHIEFKNASKYQARELFNRFYLPTPSAEGAEDSDEKETVDSGYDTDSTRGSTPPSPTSDEQQEKTEKDTEESDMAFKSSNNFSPFKGIRHAGRAPDFGRTRIAELALQFSDVIPERECSMASLQGYLMAYKTRPVEAACEVGAWVDKEHAARLVKEQQEKEKGAVAKEKAKDAKKREKDNKEIKSAAATAPAPALAPCACQKVPTCATCGGASVEKLPPSSSKLGSPVVELSPQASVPVDANIATPLPCLSPVAVAA
ncbi:hypothetical protein D9615_005443 [Tricholomella constricta]|uniref:Mitochondrial chaperone BCS1 n=1 Tax=Tricholomella constricta TaxID=117010 RepID=A0A8H5HDY0_9AGAR|nr:hypothetical protein D9615_005443 [Tricholomella constricta]